MPQAADTPPASNTSHEALTAEIARLRGRVAELESHVAELESQLTPPNQELVQDSLLREAIESLVDGFALFDEKQNLIYCNARYRELYSPLSDDWELGVSLESIARESAGHFLRVPDDDVDAFVEQRLTINRLGDGSWQEQQLTDGRHFRVTEKRLGNGCVVGIRTDITNLRRTEAELRWLLDSLDQSDDGYAVFDADDRLVFGNRTWREVHNAVIVELLVPGIPFRSLMQALLDRGQIAEAVGWEQQWLEERLERHDHPAGPFTVQRGPGVWHQITESRLSEGGVVLVGTDISNLKARETDLKRVEAAWLDAIASMSEGFSYWDENDKLVICNDTYKEMFAPIADALKPGASFVELGQLMIERSGLAPTENSDTWMEGRMRQRVHNEATEFHFADGRWIRCIDAQTRDGGRLCFRIDITEQKRSAKALTAAVDAAERANRTKSEFLARMSHELRTPLNAILGFGQLLQIGKEPSLDGRPSEYVDQILRAGDHLLGLIDEILDLAKVESGQLHLEIGALRVESVVVECRELMAPMAATFDVEFTQDIEESLPPVQADVLRLKQILLNLLSNAVKYNRPEGSVNLRVSHAASSDEGPSLVRFQVSDTGCGIAPGDIERLFDPFERLAETDNESEGTGIGLSITRRLVEAMNGTVEVQSTLGQGSTFTVELPAAKLASAPANGLPAATEQATDETNRDKRTDQVLYIEDDSANANLMRRIIETRPNTTLIHAHKGKLGLELARKNNPKLVLLDMNLPDMSGPEIAQWIKTDPELSSIPVVAVTGDANRLSAGSQRGRSYYAIVKKPFHVEEIRDIIERVLSSQ